MTMETAVRRTRFSRDEVWQCLSAVFSDGPRLRSLVWAHSAEHHGASQGALVVTNPTANPGDLREAALIPGSGRSPGGGHCNPLQCFCLENPMDREAWGARVH